jgi:hypothetical protein
VVLSLLKRFSSYFSLEMVLVAEEVLVTVLPGEIGEVKRMLWRFPAGKLTMPRRSGGFLKIFLTGPRLLLLCSGSSSALSLSPQSSSGDLDNGDRVVVPLDKGHGEHPWSSPGVVTGGGKDDPFLSGDVLGSISPTPVVLRRPD